HKMLHEIGFERIRREVLGDFYLRPLSWIVPTNQANPFGSRQRFVHIVERLECLSHLRTRGPHCWSVCVEPDWREIIHAYLFETENVAINQALLTRTGPFGN